MRHDPPPGNVGFVSVLRHGEFRWLWIAQLQSLLGEQLARVAIAVLVYDRTKSGLASAAVYAATLLPALVGGVVLGPLADRMPRRALLIWGDLARAALLAGMALPGLSVWAIVVLLVISVGIGGVWSAAESALIADIVVGDTFVVGTGLRAATAQAAQLVGFAVGGAAVAAVGTGPALAVNAATFAISATLLRLGVRPRPPAAADGPRRGWVHGARTILGERSPRTLLAFSWLLGLLVVPEGLAAPYAATVGGGPARTGLLLAAVPAGVLVGTLVYSRLSAATRARLLAPLAVAAGAPLICCVARPGLAITLVLWAICGACTAYQVQVVAEFVDVVPESLLGQGFAVAWSGLLAAQGVGVLLGGVVAQATSAATAVAVAGAAAVVLAGLLAIVRSAARVVAVS